MEREESRAVNLFGEGKSLAKITKENSVKTIKAIKEKNSAVTESPKNFIQKRLLLKLDCLTKGWFAESLEILESLDVNLRVRGL